ncbi:YoaK family protein [Streptomyces sp. NPDC054956]
MTSAVWRRGILRPLAARLFPPGADGAESAHGVLPPLLIVLTFVSGVVDAVSYLGLGHVFVANMTGNVVFLGFALAGDRSLSAPDSLLAVGAFLTGALAAGRLRRSTGAGRMFAPLVGVQTALVGGALAVTAAGAGPRIVIALLALGMGLQNAVVHRLAVPDLTTTVVTRALTGLAADPWGPASLRRLVTVVALLLGALAGGLLTLRTGSHGSLWALALAVALLGCVVLARSPRAGRGSGTAAPS